MALSQQLRERLESKLEKQIQLEIKGLQAQLNEVPPPPWRRRLSIPFKWLAGNVPIITAVGAIATLYLGLVSYQKDINEKRETRFYSLVEILQQHAQHVDGSNQDIATAAIGAIRSGYSKDRKYAFLIAFVTMPYAILKDSQFDALRRIASQTLADSIYRIDDYAEFQTIFAKWYSVVSSAKPNDSSVYLSDIQRVVCALGRTIKRFGVPGPSNMSSCGGFETGK